jgi:propionate catabolism operon transcriptional regulator
MLRRIILMFHHRNAHLKRETQRATMRVRPFRSHAMPLSIPPADRKPIIWAVALSKLRQLFEDIAPGYRAAAEVRLIGKGFEEALAEIRERLRHEAVDVIVAAGSNGAFLRQHLGIPVVLVKVSGFDMLQALTRARQLSPRIALVTHQSVPAELQAFQKQFGLPFAQRAYLTAEDAKNAVRELAAQGVEVVAGPGLVTELAEAAGLSGIFFTSHDSVREALDDALEVARIGRMEAARRERLNTILRQLNEGVVAVDMAERIQTCNPAMEKLLQRPAAQALGQRLSDLAPELGLATTLQTGEPELENILTLGGKTVVVNRMPIHEQGVQTGAVLTFQEAAAIQRVDRHLRSRQKPRHLAARYELDHIVGSSLAMQRTRALAAKYARTDATLLIVGESGTGKELLAQGIHNAGRRREHPFVALNCAAFPELLLESELFGYEEGAFTGSRRGGKPGLIETAHTGTIFLDEVGEMPVALQTRLLRVLQEKEVLRLGAVEPTPVDVRVIAATHRDLGERVRAGLFRQDLYYRLNILRLEVPALRERLEDLPLLAAHLLGKASRKGGTAAQADGVLRALLPALARHSWPGNVRELENLMERLALVAEDAEGEAPPGRAQWADLFPELFAATDIRASHADAAQASEAERIRQVLARCQGDRQAACRELGISRSTLWRKLKQ